MAEQATYLNILGRCAALILALASASGAVHAQAAPQGPPNPLLKIKVPSIKDLSPIPTEPGILVCDPASTDNPATEADFGAGCGRWLQFVVGGQPGAGRTPLWRSIWRVRVELKFTDLRLEAVDALKLARRLGATRVAVGVINPAPGGIRLTYTLLDPADGAAVGAPLDLEGTEEQIAAGLPGMARELAGRLEIDTPGAAKPTSPAPADLRITGHASLEQWLSTEDGTRLSQIAGHYPIAAMLDSVLPLSPPPADQPNALQLAESIFRNDTSPQERPAVLEAADRARKQDPRSALLAMSIAYGDYNAGDFSNALQAAEEAVRLSPSSADAWESLVSVLSYLGSTVRQGRFPGDMSGQEWQFVSTLYESWVATSRKVVSLDPAYSNAWYDLSQAGAFSGAGETADAAFWKAYDLGLDTGDLFWWGLQLYQPKWFDNPKKLARVAHLAASKRYPTLDWGLYIASALSEAGFGSLAHSVTTDSIQQAQERMAGQETAQNQVDVRARNAMIRSLMQYGDSTEALREATALTAVAPTDADARLSLAGSLTQARRYRESAEQYGIGIAMRPEDSMAHNALGYCENQIKDYAGAEKEFREALRIQPQLVIAQIGLADSLRYQGQLLAAMHEFRTAAENYPAANAGISMVYSEMGNYAAALPAAETAARWSSDSWSFFALTLAEAGLRHFDEALAAAKSAFLVDPDRDTDFSDFARLLLKCPGIDGERMMAGVVHQFPDYGDAHLGLALVLQHKKATERAAQQFSEATRLMSLKLAHRTAEETKAAAALDSSLDRLRVQLDHSTVQFHGAGSQPRWQHLVKSIDRTRMIYRYETVGGSASGGNPSGEWSEYTVPLGTFQAGDADSRPTGESDDHYRVRVVCGKMDFDVFTPIAKTVQHKQTSWLNVDFDSLTKVDAVASAFRDVAKLRDHYDDLKRQCQDYNDEIAKIRAASSHAA